MLRNSHLFYRYYDTLFSTKDYAGEVAAVYRYCTGQQLYPLESVLEIGCGTGNHTLELARNPRIHVTAVDVDAEMLALAQRKTELINKKNISFVSGRSIARNVDLCVALFNVVNYICEDELLRMLYADVSSSLRSGGICIFDCWNGTAALLNPPGSKKYEQCCDGQRISCCLTSQTDFIKKITTLNYQLDLFNTADKKIDSENHKIEHRLWTPEQIKSALLESGLEVETVCIPFKFEMAAADVDWKLMFVCRKL